jgi:hypothetical protein
VIRSADASHSSRRLLSRFLICVVVTPIVNGNRRKPLIPPIAACERVFVTAGAVESHRGPGHSSVICKRLPVCPRRVPWQTPSRDRVRAPAAISDSRVTARRRTAIYDSRKEQMVESPSSMLVVSATWLVFRRKTGAASRLISVGRPRYVPESAEDSDRPGYDQIVRRITEYAFCRPKLRKIRRNIFISEKHFEILKKSISK